MTAKRKVEDAVLIESYKKHGSVWKVGEEVGIGGQSVHERLTKLGAIEPHPCWTEEQIATLTRFYVERRLCPKDKFSLEDLAKDLGRPKTSLCKKARELGLTSQHRRLSQERCQEMAQMAVKWHAENEHPKGMLGKKHSDEWRKRFSEIVKQRWLTHPAFIDGSSTFKGLKTKATAGNLIKERGGVSWRGGKRTIGGIEKYFRSGWEANYARYLQLLVERGNILKWEHEPDTFWFEGIQRGSRMYVPDFKVWVEDGKFFYIEVKGWMDQKSKTKLERMAKYYPEHFIYVVQEAEINKIEHFFGPIIEGWELRPDRKSFYGYRNGKRTTFGKKLDP